MNDNSGADSAADNSTAASENVDTEKLVKLGKAYLDTAQLQRQRAYNYYLKVKYNADYKEKVKIRKREYYINNKDLLTQKERNKYRNNVEYHDKLRARAKALYKLKTADIPKLRRVRKPQPQDEDIDDKPSPKPKGRPKAKAIVNV